MALGDLIDAAIEPFAPQTAARRRAARMGLNAIRQYDAAGKNRRTQGWNRPATSADAENMRAILTLRDGSRDLVRNNKYAASAVRQVTVNLIGDGIAPQAVHSDKAVQAAAQSGWDRWAESRVDGFGDFYEVEKLAGRGMVEGGETLVMWRADKQGPDGRCDVLEGDYLDPTRNQPTDANGVRIVQGVQFDADGYRSHYWLFPDHPGDLFGGRAAISHPMAAQHIDHVYERLRAGQTRGVSWLSSVAMTLRDISDIEDAVRLKKKVEACLAIVLTPGENSGKSPLTDETAAQGTGKPDIETIRPGMVLRPPPGTTVSSVTPSSTGDGVDFIRQQLAAVSAVMTPYHLMTGDVSQANYSSLRAALLGHWAMLDDWQQNVIIPRLCLPAFERRMRRLAFETGDKRFLEVRATWATPVRRFVDPVKDLLGEIMEIRAGLKLISKSLAERGINAEDHLRQIAELNQLVDDLKLALDTDPRRLTDSGVLQQAAGYLAKGSGSSQGDTASN